MRVILIGLGLPEAVPLYHVYPGRLATRLLMPPPEGVKVDCGSILEACETIETVGLPEGYDLPGGALASLVERWRTPLTVLDGVESWRYASKAQELLGRRVGVAARTQGFLEPGKADLEGLSALKVDYVSALTGDPRPNVRLARAAEKAASLGLHVEVSVYLERASLEDAMPAAETASSIGAPLHVHIADHEGGGPVRSLRELLRRRVDHLYIHAGPYSERDTVCPRCQAPLIFRGRGYASSFNLKGGRCPRCGYPLRLVGGVPGRPDPRTRIISSKMTEWLDPRFILTQLGNVHRGSRGE